MSGIYFLKSVSCPHSEDLQQLGPLKSYLKTWFCLDGEHIVLSRSRIERTPTPPQQAAVRECTLALLDAATGLRASELLVLRWDDIDFKGLEIRITESIWHQVVGVCKTEASAKPVPMDEYMAEDLLRGRRSSPYPMEGDWVFASPRMKGNQPYWPDNLMKRYMRPVRTKPASPRTSVGTPSATPSALC